MKKISNNETGIALLFTIMMMSLILFLSLYFLNFSVTEDKISKSQTMGDKTYYLAEAGVNEMIWKLKNDPNYKDSFETNPSWTASFTRTDPFGAGSGSYTVSITNTSLAHGEITSTGSIDLDGGKATQRIIKTSVYKAIGQSSIGNNAGYADGNIDISSSAVNFYNGSAHSNNNFILNNNSRLYVDSDLQAVGNFLPSWTSSTTIKGIVSAANYPPGAALVNMPAVDFDSSATSSYKNKADIVYTANQFDSLLKNNNPLTLAGPITFVSGDVEIDRKIDLTINGLLVVDGTFEAGDTGNSSKAINLTVNYASGTPAGILAKSKVDLTNYYGNVDIHGVIYANDQVNITNFQPGSSSFNIVGGVVGRKLTVTSCWQPINITRDADIAAVVFPATDFSPTILVEHWEEDY